MSGLQLLSEITLVLPNMATVLWPDNAQALSAEELAKLPGYSCDVEGNRAKAKQLLKEAGHENLSFTLTNRAIPHPYDALGIYVLDQWQRTGINASMDSLPTAPYAAARKSGNFEVIMDFAPEFADSAALNWGKYISRSKSPANFARYEDPSWMRCLTLSNTRLMPPSVPTPPRHSRNVFWTRLTGSS